ncbi:MAG: DUF4129 domain-containing protein [Chloroflexota bacterium]
MRLARPSTLFYLAFLGTELSYLYLLASLLNRPAYILILMLLLYPLALLPKLIPQPTLPQRLRFSLELSLVTLVILLVAGERLLSSLAAGQVDIPGIILGMGLCGIIWRLGYSVPQHQVNYTTVAFRLQIGILVVLAFSQAAGSVPPVFLFFLLAPLALFLARWASALSRGATALRSPNPGHLLLAGAVVMVPGMVLILLLSPGLAHAIVYWLKNILLKILDWLNAQHQPATTPPREFKFDLNCNVRPEPGGLPPPASMPPPAEGGNGISPIVIWIIAFVIFLAIVAFIAFALRKRQAGRRSHPVAPVRFQLRLVSLGMLRSLMSLFPQLLKKLWLWLTSLFTRWWRRPRPAEEPLISIRALYRHLLRWSARQGIARAPTQTPLEHLERLEDRFPQQQDDLKQLTEAYLLARYSQKPISPEEFDRVKKAWQRAVIYHTP